MEKEKTFSEYCRDCGGKAVLVTHDGLCHTDDVMSSALLWYLMNKRKIQTVIIRTRKEREVPEGSIIYDAFGGFLDHHGENKLDEDGHPFSSLGLIYKWVKDELISLGLDEDSYEEIKRTLITPIDITDNTGKMNPLSYSINLIRDCGGSTTDKAFYECLGVCEKIIEAAIESGIKKAADHRRFKDLPTITNEEFPGLRIRISREYLTGVINPEECYIWEKSDDVYGIKLNSEKYEIIPGLTEDIEKGIVFTHKSGYTGCFRGIDNLRNIIRKKGGE